MAAHGLTTAKSLNQMEQWLLFMQIAQCPTDNNAFRCADRWYRVAFLTEWRWILDLSAIRCPDYEPLPEGEKGRRSKDAEIASASDDYETHFASWKLASDLLRSSGGPMALNLNKLHKDGHVSDVHLVVQGKKMAAHYLVLSFASPVFATMFHPSRFVEGRTRRVDIDDVRPAVFRDLLRYLYTGHYRDRRPQQVEELFVVADKYQIGSLRDDLERLLMRTLRIDNVFQRLVLGHLHSKMLLQAALNHLMAYKDRGRVYRSLRLLDPYPALLAHLYHLTKSQTSRCRTRFYKIRNNSSSSFNGPVSQFE